MPTIVDTPSKGRVTRLPGPGSDPDAAAVEGHEAGRGDATPGVADGDGSQSVQRFELLEDPSFWRDHNVQVIIRVRPLNSTEISLQGNRRCVKQDTCQSITWTGHPESRFTFDLVADEFVSQEKLFKVAGVPMVDNCVSGYNSCMFAYGQTGSGKTHTMLGDIEEGTRRHSVNCGMTPRVFEYLFSKIQKEKEVRREEKLQFACKCSFLEIYNEHILDLLDPSSSNLQMREDLKKGVYVENLSEFEVASARDVIRHLLQGAANRKVAATNMNRASSRSHSVFTCVIESKWESQGITHHRFSRLNLVDLAGSERQKSSGAEGERLKEATNINKSLSTLGLVIMNLAVSNKKSLHVPYRDSKLTFLLQDSLGGNSKTIIIANISPSNCCALETHSTLKFAQRAKFIRNNAIVNEEASGDVLTMRLQIQELKKEVSRLRSAMDRNAGAERSPEKEEKGCNGGRGSPGSFKWEGIQESFSPLATDRRASSKRRDYEAALAAAVRRDLDKEKALKTLSAEREAAERLANQIMGEVKGLKLTLRFREEGIKRLQAVAAGKLAVEPHLAQEREELLKEIELLRHQLDCNPKVTRFATENLRLKEEVARLQSFVEEGERETMDAQINQLEEKLLEALDWKLMHEKDADLSQSWDSSSLSEENEFLRLQAIQNEREVEALRKNLGFCLEAKEKLERRVDELTRQLEEGRRDSSPPDRDPEHAERQAELKAMVDAIAAASQREAEAHEMAIVLAKEKEELRSRIGLLIDDNNKLIQLYEAAVSRGGLAEEEDDRRRERKSSSEEAEDLRGQLHDLQEENEKLMGLYENAMHERDEFKKRLLQLLHPRDEEEEEEHVHLGEEKPGGLCEKIEVEEDGGQPSSNGDDAEGEKEKQPGPCERVELDEGGSDGSAQKGEGEPMEDEEEDDDEEKMPGCRVMAEAGGVALMEEDGGGETEDERKMEEQAEAVEQAAGKLEETIGMLGELWAEMQRAEDETRLRQEEMSSLRILCKQAEDARKTAEEKLLLLLHSARSFQLDVDSDEISLLEKREDQAKSELHLRAEVAAENAAQLRRLLSLKDEAAARCQAAAEQEAQLRAELTSLKAAYRDAERQSKETKKVLFAIENRVASGGEAAAPPVKKAFELLRAEEELPRLAGEMKVLRERISAVQVGREALRLAAEELEGRIKSAEEEAATAEEGKAAAEAALREMGGERERAAAVLQESRALAAEVWEATAEYQECVFQAAAKGEELRMCEEELMDGARAVGGASAARRLASLLEQCRAATLSLRRGGGAVEMAAGGEEDAGTAPWPAWSTAIAG